MYLTKDLYPEYINSPRNSIIKRQPNKNQANIFVHFIKDIQIVNKQVKIYLTLLIISAIQIKAIRFQNPPTIK